LNSAQESYLESKLQNHIISEESFSNQLFQVLNQMHEQKWAHRDLKPSHLIINGYQGNSLKLIDFGQAYSFSGNPESENVSGTMPQRL